jgi:hypothetical protein
MRQRILITALAAVAITGVLASPAAASDLLADDTPTAEELAETHAYTEPAQRFCGGWGGGTPATSAAAVRVARVKSARELDDCSPALVYWCRTARVARYQRSLLGFILFRYWHWKRWCWRSPHILSVTSGTYLTNVDANILYRGEVARADSWYVWCCGTSTSGHASRRQAHLENCVFRFGCLRSYYPWVKINAHADGSYTWRTGT